MNTALNPVSRLIALVAVCLSLAACATSNGGSYSNGPSPQISYAPAIDVPYDVVAQDVAKHIGTDVRWGGQIIQSEDVGSITKLTVFAYPLTRNGKPARQADEDFSGGRFIVEIANDELRNARLQDRFVTVYGKISGELNVVNGPLELALPVVDALEIEDWKYSDRRRYADIHLGLAYHGLGFRYGHGYGHRYGFYGSPYYGYHYSYYPRYRYKRHHRRHHRGH